MGSIKSIKTLVSAKSIDSVKMARNDSIDKVVESNTTPA